MDLEEKLQNIDISFEELKSICDENIGNDFIESLIAMNISRRTKVDDIDHCIKDDMIYLLEKLSNSNDMSTRWAVAKSRYTPVNILEKLAKDDINLVRALVATNPNTPVRYLNDFFGDEKIVRDGLSGNPSTPQKLLNVLADDSDKMVRLRVADNPSTSEEILKRLANDESVDIKKAVSLRLESNNQ
jgi:hypothetical protein